MSKETSTPKTRLRMSVAYDGTDFCGWQKQNQGGKLSVQQHLEQAFQKIFQQEIQITGSGRTDAGVHAKDQNLHFDVNKPESAFNKWDLPWAVRSMLPETISIKKVWIAPPDFHATRSAVKKTYKYYIWSHPRRPAFLNRYSLWLRNEIDLDLLNNYSQKLLGEHDFKSFQSVGTPLFTTVRTIHSCGWKQVKPHLIEFEITGSGFLKQMVRNIVGTELKLEKQQAPAARFEEIIKSMDRNLAGAPAEPQGLFLNRVYYPSRLDNQCREI